MEIYNPGFGPYPRADLRVELINGNNSTRYASFPLGGAGEILEVALPGGDNLMLPFTREVAPEIDIAGGRIVVAPPRETTAEKPRP